MQIKSNYLAQQLTKKTFSLYWLIGQETYLIEESLKHIKSAIKKSVDCEEKMVHIESASDWQMIEEEANSYSLFSELTVLNVIYNKKSLDSSGKKMITNYLEGANSRCILIIRTPNIPLKQVQWLTAVNEALVISHYPLTQDDSTQWIGEQLKARQLTYDSTVPALIQQYTQGNMLACAQAIEKISLSYPIGSHITSKEALEQVFNQCEHSLFELVDTCLLGQVDKSIQIIRHAANNKTEATLVLWILAQELRQLIQLHALNARAVDFKTACSQLKIWPQKNSLYQAAFKRISLPQLKGLIRQCYSLDEQIKTNLDRIHIWDKLEQLAISFRG